MSLFELLLNALELPLPSTNERVRRYERIGCLVGLLVVFFLGVIVAVAYFLGDP